MKKLPKWIVAGLLILLLGAATPAQVDEKIVRLYLDADRSGAKQSGLFDQKHPDAHEALGIEDFVMAHYGEANEIIIEPWKLK